jgi:hypothetical protein
MASHPIGEQLELLISTIYVVSIAILVDSVQAQAQLSIVSTKNTKKGPALSY